MIVEQLNLVDFRNYAAADVMWITPLRDDLNLVAKEFVAAHAGHAVIRPRHLPQLQRRDPQHVVAGRVPVGVVDALEQVEVEMDQAEGQARHVAEPRRRLDRQPDRDLGADVAEDAEHAPAGPDEVAADASAPDDENSAEDDAADQAAEDAADEAALLDDAAAMFDDTLFGVDQIRDLVVNLRNFSRLDQARVTEVSLNDCVEQTLMIANNVLKNRVEIVRRLADLPAVDAIEQDVQPFPWRSGQFAGALDAGYLAWIFTGADPTAPVGYAVLVGVLENELA